MAAVMKATAELTLDCVGFGLGSLALGMLEAAYQMLQDIKVERERCLCVVRRMQELLDLVRRLESEHKQSQLTIPRRFEGVIVTFHADIKKFKKRWIAVQWARTDKLAGILTSVEEEIGQLLKLLNVESAVKTSSQLEQIGKNVEKLLTGQRGLKQSESEEEREEADVVSAMQNPRAFESEMKGNKANEDLYIMKHKLQFNRQSYSTRKLDLLDGAFKFAMDMAGVKELEVPRWLIPSDDVEYIGESFADGSYGRVYRARWNFAPVVVKELLEPELTKRFFKEVTVWKTLENPHIVKLYGANHVADSPFFVSEDCTNGNLVDYLNDNRPQLWQLLFQAAVGLLYLHSQNVIHGDLKCNDILVGADGLAKITDFGFSFIRQESASRSQKTSEDGIRNKAPELLSIGPHAYLGTKETPTDQEGKLNATNPRFASDVYSFGLCVFESFTGASPFALLGEEEIMEKLYSDDPMPDRPEEMNDAVWEFVKELLAFDLEQRPTMREVVTKLRIFADLCPLCEGGQAIDVAACCVCGSPDYEAAP